jgi:hypothetical protein
MEGAMSERFTGEHQKEPVVPFITKEIKEILDVVITYQGMLHQPLDPGETSEDVQVRAGAYLDRAMRRLQPTDLQRALAFAAVFSQTDAEFYATPPREE